MILNVIYNSVKRLVLYQGHLCFALVLRYANTNFYSRSRRKMLTIIQIDNVDVYIKIYRCMSPVTCIYVTRWKFGESKARDLACPQDEGRLRRSSEESRRKTSECSDRCFRSFTAKAYQRRQDAFCYPFQSNFSIVLR